MGTIVRAIRGATTVEENREDQILEATQELLLEMIKTNDLDKNDLISIFFTLTPDLNAAFPARAAREIGITQVPLMCASEVDVKGALGMCIRVMIHANFDEGTRNEEINHIYLKDSGLLRPDLSGRNHK